MNKYHLPSASSSGSLLVLAFFFFPSIMLTVSNKGIAFGVDQRQKLNNFRFGRNWANVFVERRYGVVMVIRLVCVCVCVGRGGGMSM